MGIVNSIIIDRKQADSSYLKKYLDSRFPEIKVHGEAPNYAEADRLIKTVHPLLVFLDACTVRSDSLSALRAHSSDHFEVIYLSDRSEDAVHAIREDACGFLLKPLNVSDIVLSVGRALHRLTEKTTLGTSIITGDSAVLPHTKLIGIPTLGGMEFLHIHEITSCEGLQKCTQIRSTRKTSMISAYNIGEFRKLLEQYGFFSCHKSHLINLMHVRRLTHEGFIYLSDNSAVPLARRKRQEFLDLMKHL